MRSENEVALTYGLSFVNETHSVGAQRIVRDKQDEFHQWLAERDERIARAIEAHGRKLHPNPHTEMADAYIGGAYEDAAALVREGKF